MGFHNVQKKPGFYLPLTLPSSARDFAFSKTASRSKLTECSDITPKSECSALVRDLFGRVLSAIALQILGDKVLISIPWKT